jgi:hypothetical protein
VARDCNGAGVWGIAEICCGTALIDGGARGAISTLPDGAANVGPRLPVMVGSLREGPNGLPNGSLAKRMVSELQAAARPDTSPITRIFGRTEKRSEPKRQPIDAPEFHTQRN